MTDTMPAAAPAPESAAVPLLAVDDVSTTFSTDRGIVHAVDGVSFTLERGRTLGVVGESGSGKTVLSRSIMGLLPKRGVGRSGSIKFEGEEIGALGPKDDAPLLGRAHVDGVPGPDDVAQPGDEDREADHRVDPHPPRRHP